MTTRMSESDVLTHLTRLATSRRAAQEATRAKGVADQHTPSPRVARRRHLLNDGLVQITLPIPPSVNGIYRPGENGQRRLTDKAKQWKRDAAALVRAAHSHATPYALPVKLEVTLTPGDARRFDIDNRLKLLLDALQDGALIKDDAQILELSVSKRPPCKAMSCATLSITKIRGV